MDLERIGHPYWILYEGTPGGDYDENEAFMVDSSGRRDPANSTWERRLPDPRWIWFGTQSSPYILYLIDHTPRPADTLDSYWSMEGNMTVFGFGRVLDSADPRWHHLMERPARLTVGLLPAATERDIAECLNEIAGTGR